MTSETAGKCAFPCGGSRVGTSEWLGGALPTVPELGNLAEGVESASLRPIRTSNDCLGHRE